MRLSSRREFLGTVGLAAGLAVGASRRQPNILFIMVDQLAADGLSCVGNPRVSTPALDALAARATRYEAAYVTQPLCQPCRSSLQTGRFPHELGVLTNERPIQGEPPLLGRLVAAAGYRTPYIGKWHVAPGLREAGYEPLAAGKDPDKVERAVEWLGAAPTEPWFLTVSFTNPHNVCQLARRQELPDGPIPPPPDDPAALPPLPPNHALPAHEPPAIRDAWNRDREFQYPTRDWTELDWRRYLWGYWRIVEKVDAQIGRVLAALDESGQADRTVVIFFSDHGEGLARHHWNQKQVLYEQVVRVPFLIALPGQTPAVTSNLVSPCLDIPATILDLVGAAAPAEWTGRSLVRELPEREAVFAETTFAKNREDYGIHGRLVRTARRKYIVYTGNEPREQLFDLLDDPGETRNLAVEPAHRSELNRHRRLLLEWARQTDDRDFPHVRPDGPTPSPAPPA